MFPLNPYTATMFYGYPSAPQLLYAAVSNLQNWFPVHLSFGWSPSPSPSSSLADEQIFDPFAPEFMWLAWITGVLVVFILAVCVFIFAIHCYLRSDDVGAPTFQMHANRTLALVQRDLRTLARVVERPHKLPEDVTQRLAQIQQEVQSLARRVERPQKFPEDVTDALTQIQHDLDSLAGVVEGLEKKLETSDAAPAVKARPTHLIDARANQGIHGLFEVFASVATANGLRAADLADRMAAEPFPAFQDAPILPAAKDESPFDDDILEGPVPGAFTPPSEIEEGEDGWVIPDVGKGDLLEKTEAATSPPRKRVRFSPVVEMELERPPIPTKQVRFSPVVGMEPDGPSTPTKRVRFSI
ncbi:hypothetical protein H2200_010119 [Cladophialophora chaetospira]|uniref:Uncharacterized protein n=1 Tax=Cladophialophora chaetospira TaxID=386627 RepID=A0AA38X2H4_9EURO|nr:hypothetical protein H2200_010119 [Cladophialophora chaetospira]